MLPLLPPIYLLRHTTNQHTLVKIPLLQRGINSLIAEYLQCNSYNYTYSVFLPEVSLNSSTQLSHTEICSLLKLNEQQIQQILTSISSSTTGDRSSQSLLTTLLQHLHTLLAPSHNRHPISTQTDQSELSLQRPSLDTLLQDVDNLYEQKRQSQALILHDQQRTTQLQYEKQLQSQYEQQWKLKFEQYKETELSTVRQHERQRYTTQLDAELRTLQSQYDEKYTKLKHREQQLEVEQRQLQMKNDTTRYEERQKQLEEMQRLQSKELELQRSNNLLQKELELEKHSWSEKHRLLDQRLMEVENMRREFDVKIENEKKLMRLEHETTVKALNEQISDLNQTLQRLQHRHSSTSQSFDDAHSQITKLLSEITTEKQLNNQHEQQLRLLTTENTTLQQQLKDSNFELQHYRKLDSILTNKAGDTTVIVKQIDGLKQQLQEQQVEAERQIKQLKLEHKRELQELNDSSEDKLGAEQRRYTQLLYEWQHTCDTLQAELQNAKREEEQLHRQVDDLESQVRQQRRVATTLQQQLQQRPVQQAEMLNSSSLMVQPVRPHTAGAALNGSFLNTSMPLHLNTSALYGSTGLNTTTSNFQPYTAYPTATPHHKHLAERRSLSLDESLFNVAAVKQGRSAEIDADLYARQQAMERLEMEERTLKNEFDALVSHQHGTGQRSVPATHIQQLQFPPPHPQQQPLQPYLAAVQQPPQLSVQPLFAPQPQLPTVPQPSMAPPVAQAEPQIAAAVHPQRAEESVRDVTPPPTSSNVTITNLQQQQKSAPASPAKKHVAQIAEKAKQKAQQAATSAASSRPGTAHHRTTSFEGHNEGSQHNEERERAREERRMLREQDKKERERREALESAAKVEAERLERERFEQEFAQRNATVETTNQYQPKQPHSASMSQSTALPGLKPAGNTIDEFLETSYDQLFPGDSANLLMEELKQQEQPATANTLLGSLEDEFQSLHDETEGSQPAMEEAF